MPESQLPEQFELRHYHYTGTLRDPLAVGNSGCTKCQNNLTANIHRNKLNFALTRILKEVNLVLLLIYLSLKLSSSTRRLPDTVNPLQYYTTCPVILDLRSTLPATQLIQVDSLRMVISRSQETLRVIAPSRNEIPIPRNPIRPRRTLIGHPIRIRNDPHLRQRNDPLPARQRLERIVLRLLRVMIPCGGVDIHRRDITLCVPGVPRRLIGVANPDHVVQVVVVCQAVVDDVPELLVRSRTLCAPPEPSTISLVQWAP